MAAPPVYFDAPPVFAASVDQHVIVQVHRQPPMVRTPAPCLAPAYILHVHDGADVRMRGHVCERRLDHTFERGRCFVAPPASGAVLQWQERRYDFVRVRVTPEAIARSADDLGLQPGRDCAINVRDPLLAEVANALAREAAVPVPDPAYLEALTTVVATQMIRSVRRPLERARTVQPFGATTRRKLYDFIVEHIDDALSLSTLAAQCGLSSYHFLRRFRATFGTTPHEYVVEKRIELARALLGNASLSVSDIALRVGLTHQSHFSRIFRERTGLSPSAFRAQV